jgi:hypothetical protein
MDAVLILSQTQKQTTKSVNMLEQLKSKAQTPDFFPEAQKQYALSNIEAS